jgi:hypothetical protein
LLLVLVATERRRMSLGVDRALMETRQHLAASLALVVVLARVAVAARELARSASLAVQVAVVEQIQPLSAGLEFLVRAARAVQA